MGVSPEDVELAWSTKNVQPYTRKMLFHIVGKESVLLLESRAPLWHEESLTF